MTQGEDNKEVKNEPEKLSYELLMAENKKLSEKIASLESDIQDMKTVIKLNLSTSGDGNEKTKTTKERHDELEKKIKEAFK